MKDTVRIIMFLGCNFKCEYCCNEKSKFNEQFEEKSFAEIDFNNYKTVCLTGGEPFFHKDWLYSILGKIPPEKPIFLYTNGVLIDLEDILRIAGNYNIQGINIGLHGVNQPKFILPELDSVFSVRYQAQDINREKLLSMYPDRITEKNSKFWKMYDCFRSNEDWILLTDFQGE
jgi:molybdenum cofactor biosynthesis enzyme MoaA